MNDLNTPLLITLIAAIAIGGAYGAAFWVIGWWGLAILSIFKKD
jgi:hypothetical protein